MSSTPTISQQAIRSREMGNYLNVEIKPKFENQKYHGLSELHISVLNSLSDNGQYWVLFADPEKHGHMKHD